MQWVPMVPSAVAARLIASVDGYRIRYARNPQGVSDLRWMLLVRYEQYTLILRTLCRDAKVVDRT
jgi:hypothetical protein